MAISVDINSLSQIYLQVRRDEPLAQRPGIFTRFVNWVNRKSERVLFDKYQTIFQELTQLLNNLYKDQMNPAEAKAYLPEFVNFINALSRVNLSFEKAAYFNSERMESLMDRLLKLTYEIEGELRVLSSRNRTARPTDETLKKALSEMNKKNLSDKL